MAWIAVGEEEIRSSIAKFFSDDEIQSLLERTDAKPGDLICFVADSNQVAYDALARSGLRLQEDLIYLIKMNSSFFGLLNSHYLSMMTRKSAGWQSTIPLLHLWTRIWNTWKATREECALRLMISC